MEGLIGIIDSMPAFFALTSFSHSFFPLPIFPSLLHLAGEGIYPIWLIALIGSIGTCVASLLDYYICSRIARLKSAGKVLKSKWYLACEKLFRKTAFISIVISAFLLFIPFDPFKLFAATTGYSKYRFTAAVFIGRFPLYYLVGWMGEEIRFSPEVLSIAFVVLLAIPLVEFLRRKIVAGIASLKYRMPAKEL